MKTHKVVEGEPYEVSTDYHIDVCCDCGLSHRNRFTVTDAAGKPIKGARLRITTWLAPNHTKSERKKIKIFFGER